MARILVWTKTSKTGDFIAGDAISVVDNNHVFSEQEDPDVWVANGNLLVDFPGHTKVIDVPSLSVEKAQRLVMPKFRAPHIGDPEFTAPDLEDRKVKVAQREWQVKTAEETSPDRFVGN